MFKIMDCFGKIEYYYELIGLVRVSSSLTLSKINTLMFATNQAYMILLRGLFDENYRILLQSQHLRLAHVPAMFIHYTLKTATLRLLLEGPRLFCANIGKFGPPIHMGIDNLHNYQNLVLKVLDEIISRL